MFDLCLRSLVCCRKAAANDHFTQLPLLSSLLLDYVNSVCLHCDFKWSHAGKFLTSTVCVATDPVKTSGMCHHLFSSIELNFLRWKFCVCWNIRHLKLIRTSVRNWREFWKSGNKPNGTFYQLYWLAYLCWCADQIENKHLCVSVEAKDIAWPSVK